jgi:hypothetical protein
MSAEDLGYEVAEPSAASLGYECHYSSPSPEDLGYGYGSQSSLPTPEELGYDVEMPTHEDLGYNVDAMERKPMFACSRHRGDLLESSSSSFDAPPAQPLRRTSAPDDAKEPEEHPSKTRERRNEPPRLPQRSKRRAMRRASTTGSTSVTVTSRPRLQMQRRITMDVSHANPLLSSPAHHTKAPRRSSMKSYSSFQDDDSISLSEGSFRQKAQRRVSFGSSATVNHVAHLHESEQDKKELYYDREELSRLRRNMKKIASQAHETGIDEAEETLRGLENYVKRAKEGKKSKSVSETELCNQIILQLQDKLKQKQRMAEQSNYCDSDTDSCSCYDSDDSSIMDSDDELVMDLQLSAKRLLRRASNTSVRLADKDAAEARAIYLESLPQEQVHAYFVNPPSSTRSGGKRRKAKTTNYNRQPLRASAIL